MTVIDQPGQPSAEQGRASDDRLSSHSSHRIDRTQRLTFSFDGKRYTAFAGDTIASALWAAGVRVLGRSFKYHRPRGPFSLTPDDANSLVRVNDEPNVRASSRLVQAGMLVSPQNAWPSLNADLMSLTQFAARLLPIGFYYKTFIRPKALWPLYEALLRRLAGLGYITPQQPSTVYDKQYAFADVLVIGGGPAGLSAALGAAASGARVMLLEESPYLGGHLLYSRRMVESDQGAIAADLLAAQLAQQVRSQPNIRVEVNTPAFGIYNHLWVGAVKEDRRLLKIRAKALVMANGAYERPLIFDNSDLPGVLLGSAAQRLMHLYAVKPGQRVVVLSANDDGLHVALDLAAAGVTVASVAELRGELDPTLVRQLAALGVPIRPNYTVTAAHGRRSVSGVTLAPIKPGSKTGVLFKADACETMACDLLVVSVGWTAASGLLYQAKTAFAYDEPHAELLPTVLPPHVYAAGRVTGVQRVERQLLDGRTAGQRAAADAGFGSAAPISPPGDDTESIRNAAAVYVDGGKQRFISFDEDVTIQDLRDAVAEGYRSMELLKRYSTLSMGPCQGKYENANVMALAAEANQQTIGETGTTTSRPPLTPVSLGALAGRMMEPVKYTAMHVWHVEQRAQMMNVGLWKRPEHYGNASAEVIATRTGVGLIDVSTLGKILLRGKDVPQLLDRLYTNKFANLAVGRARYGLMCNEEGIITDDGVSARLDDDTWYMTTTTNGASAVCEGIEWNLQSGWNYQVHVSPMTDAYAAMNLTGPAAREVLQPLTEIELSNSAFPYMGARRGLVAGVPAILLRIGFTGELGYELHVPAGYALYLWETLLKAGQPYAIQPFGVEAQRVMRLEKGHLIISQDTDGLTDPLMADLGWAVKLDKADFTGKPSLVRVERNGLTHQLVGYQMLDARVVPEEANQIVRPNPQRPLGLEILGRVTSARYSPTLKQSIGLCWLPIALSRPGSEFTVRIRGELHKGQVAPLPFYDPEGKRLRA
jgi:sarcosine oxidase subunit alpha